MRGAIDANSAVARASVAPDARRPTGAAGEERKRRIFEPESTVANPDGWGNDFSRVVLDWRAR